MQLLHSRNLHLILYYITGFSLSLVSLSATAMRVSPIAIELTTAGTGAKKTLSVTNTAKNPLPIELVVTAMDIDINGKPIPLTGGEDDLMIFPPQAVIPPDKTQTFRLQWIGDPEFEERHGYSISINQVPVDITMPEARADKIHTAVQVVMNFGVFAAVRPLMGNAEFKVRKVELDTTTDISPSTNSSKKIALTIENVGNAHNYLCNAQLTLKAGNWSKTLLPGKMLDMLGVGIILPQHTRRFLLNINDLPAKPGNITATIDMEERVGLPY